MTVDAAPASDASRFTLDQQAEIQQAETAEIIETTIRILTAMERAKELEHACNCIAALVGRRVRADYTAEHGYFVAHRCDACGDVMRIPVRDAASNLVVKADDAHPVTWSAVEWMRELGPTLRKQWLKHRCPPLDHALLGLTPDELYELFNILENDSNRTMTRALAIRDLLRAMGYAAP